MRTILAFAGVSIVGLLCGASSAQPKESTLPKGLPPSVTGHGVKIEDAKEFALRRATSEVAKLMQRHDPPLTSFVLTETFVQEHLVDAGKPGPDETFPKDITKRDDVLKAWILTFRTDSDWWSEIYRRNSEMERTARAKARESLGMRLVLGLTLVLLAGFGYVQLDAYTQGRYTAWLRLAGGGVMAVLLAGWYLVAF
ncbi:MAG: hypothetical protein HYR84_12925 [Planctomycetes bacterium]|nr:hypothetical protein [Planctomycetota bacterium]